MKRNTILEAQILKAIEVLGEATEPEIITEIKEQFAIEINDYDFMRNIRRWLAKKCITVTKLKGENAYKLRDVPPSFKSLQLYQMKGLTADGAEKILTDLELHYNAIKATIREPLYGGYAYWQCKFISLDTIAGGDGGVEDRMLQFPRRNGKPYIKRNWIRGLFRDNARLANINGSFMGEFVGISDSEPLDAKITIVNNVKVKEGLCSYETIPEGTEFSVRVRFPLRGSKIDSMEKFKDFCKFFEDAPLSGLGAYSNNFGGRIKLLSIEENS